MGFGPQITDCPPGPEGREQGASEGPERGCFGNLREGDGGWVLGKEPLGFSGLKTEDFCGSLDKRRRGEIQGRSPGGREPPATAVTEES